MTCFDVGIRVPAVGESSKHRRRKRKHTHTNKREDDYAFENECTVWAIKASFF